MGFFSNISSGIYNITHNVASNISAVINPMVNTTSQSAQAVASAASAATTNIVENTVTHADQATAATTSTAASAITGAIAQLTNGAALTATTAAHAVESTASEAAQGMTSTVRAVLGGSAATATTALAGAADTVATLPIQSIPVIGPTAASTLQNGFQTAEGLTQIANVVAANTAASVIHDVVTNPIGTAAALTLTAVNVPSTFINSVAEGNLSGALGNALNALASGLANAFPAAPLPSYQTDYATSIGNFQPASVVTPNVAALFEAALFADAPSHGFPDPTKIPTLFGLPDEGLTAFMVNGKQMSFEDDWLGVSGEVWQTPQKQLIISFESTDPDITYNAAYAVGSIASDLGVMAGQATAGEKECVNFANAVLSTAATHGISSNQVFTTGYSLGGIESEYVAQQTGIGGAGFAETGIPLSPGAKGNGDNFISVVMQGDPASQYASDTMGDQPMAPAYASGTGTLPHYGALIQVGSATDNQALMKAMNEISNLFTAPQGWNGFVAGWGIHLDASIMAMSLGVDTQTGAQAAALDAVTNSGISGAVTTALGVSNSGNLHGSVLNIANDNLGQAVSAALANHSLLVA